VDRFHLTRIAASSALAVACVGSIDDPTLYLSGTESMPLSGSSVDGGSAPQPQCDASKVLLCHVPPGNRDRGHTICVSPQGARAHRAHHAGDSDGACAGQTQPDGGGTIDYCMLVQSGAQTGAGAACVSGDTCFSGVCSGGNCMAGAEGTPCENGGDCVSLQCQASCTCAAGGPQGAGSPCTVSNQCLSSSCVSGVCAPSMSGDPCRVPTDCQPPLLCTSGTCRS
jgi:hypothetical protein